MEKIDFYLLPPLTSLWIRRPSAQALRFPIWRSNSGESVHFLPPVVSRKVEDQIVQLESLMAICRRFSIIYSVGKPIYTHTLLNLLYIQTTQPLPVIQFVSQVQPPPLSYLHPLYKYRMQFSPIVQPRPIAVSTLTLTLHQTQSLQL